MSEKYDLEEMLAEIKEDEEMEARRKKPKVSQEDILRMIREKQKG